MASTGLVLENSASTTTDLLLVPPGEVLLEEFLRPMGISQSRLALAIGVPESRINAIVKGRRTISADTDLRLCRFFGLSEGFWLRMQASHDLKLAKQALGGRAALHRTVPAHLVWGWCNANPSAP
jgi:addiction module HigA family antidote